MAGKKGRSGTSEGSHKAKRRHPIKAREDRLTVLDLLKRGYTQIEIGEYLKVHQSTVSTDYRKAIQAYMDQEQEIAGEMVWRKKLEYSEIKRQAWEAWEESREVRVKEVVEQMPDRECRACKGTGKLEPASGKSKATKCPNCEGKGKVPGARKVTTTTEKTTGDTSYLATILRCIEGERSLLGLDAPKQIEAKVEAEVLNWDALAAGLPPVGAGDEIEGDIARIIARQLDAAKGTLLLSPPDTSHPPYQDLSTDTPHPTSPSHLPPEEGPGDDYPPPSSNGHAHT